MAQRSLLASLSAATLALAAVALLGCGGGDDPTPQDPGGGETSTAASCFDPTLYVKGAEVGWLSKTTYSIPGAGATKETVKRVVVDDNATFNGRSGLIRMHTDSLQEAAEGGLIPVGSVSDEYWSLSASNELQLWGSTWEGPPRLGSAVVRYSPPVDDLRSRLHVNESAVMREAGRRNSYGSVTEEHDFDERYTVTFRGRESLQILGKSISACRFEYSDVGRQGAAPPPGVIRTEWIVRGITLQRDKGGIGGSRMVVESVTVNGQPL